MDKTTKKRTIMDYSKFGKDSSLVFGMISGIIGCGIFDGLMSIAKHFPEAGVWIVTVVVAFILLILAVFLMRIQGPTVKKIGIGLGVIAISIAIILFYLFDQNYFVQETWRVLAPISGIVLLFAGGAVSISSYFSILDENYRNKEKK